MEAAREGLASVVDKCGALAMPGKGTEGSLRSHDTLAALRVCNEGGEVVLAVPCGTRQGLHVA